jgi:hypothetical protein
MRSAARAAKTFAALSADVDEETSYTASFYESAMPAVVEFLVVERLVFRVSSSDPSNMKPETPGLKSW